MQTCCHIDPAPPIFSRYCLLPAPEANNGAKIRHRRGSTTDEEQEEENENEEQRGIGEGCGGGG
eukprot:3020813-Pyramimonas_sp.AAC.1